MPNFKKISKIFSDFLDNPSAIPGYKEKLNHIVWLNIKTNQELWNLEDLARMAELGSEHVANAKQEIDNANQIRNGLIREIDAEIVRLMQVNFSNSVGQFYSESPGMIIDRLAILFIKLSVVKELLTIIKEKELRQDYLDKKKVISKQIANIGNFLDLYFTKLKDGKVFFEIQQPIKIYNDERIKKYIKILEQKKKDSPNHIN